MNSKTDDLLPLLPTIATRRQDLPPTALIDVVFADEECKKPELRPFETPTPHYLAFLRLFR